MPVRGHEVDQLTIEAEDVAKLSSTQPRRTLGNHIKHRLDICWRSADRLEHAACCCLILQGLCRIAGARLHLLKQSRILNCDDGLIREGIDELDLTFGERANFDAPDEDYADCLASVDQGDGQRGAEASLKGKPPTLGVFIRFGQDICDLYRAPIEDGAASDEPTHQRTRLSSEGYLPVVCDAAQTIANHLKDCSVIGIT